MKKRVSFISDEKTSGNLLRILNKEVVPAFGAPIIKKFGRELGSNVISQL